MCQNDPQTAPEGRSGSRSDRSQAGGPSPIPTAAGDLVRPTTIPA